ncbi:MAG TPA: HRDC domain-containing protein [Chthoniobacterales bacterium]|nr:HRDC domain-containing protein [Chthoniobacterales bacterium]
MHSEEVLALSDTNELLHWCDSMAGEARVAVDTEGDSLHCYYEKLCLIQLSVPNQNVLIDPFQPLDSEILTRFLQSRTVVFHGCDYDLRMLRRGIQFVPGPVFDTYLAARLMGMREVGLASLVRYFFAIELPKSSQKANWARRPLTDVMIAYAVNDTKYLLPLAERLEQELRNSSRWHWYEESCARAVAAAAEDRERDPEKVWKIPGSAALPMRGLAVLRALWHWRESEAQQADRPPFQIMRNEDLVGLAQATLAGSHLDLPDWLPSSRRRRLLATIHQSLQIPEAEWPPRNRHTRVRPTSEQEKRFEQLRLKRDQLAAELALDASVLASRSALEKVVREPDTVETVLMRWQRDLLGL